MCWPFGKEVKFQMCDSYLQLRAWVPITQIYFSAGYVDGNAAFQPGFLLQVSVRSPTPFLILQFSFFFHFPGLLYIC